MQVFRSRTRATAIGAIGAISAIVLAGCGGSSSSPSSSGNKSGASNDKKPFTVLMVADFTGPGKAYGAQFQLGAQAAADFLNSTGGILGRQVVVKTVSDNFDATQAVSGLLKYLSSNPKPDLTFAGGGDAETSSMFPILDRNKLLGYSGQYGSGKLWPLAFSTQATTVPVTEHIAQWAKEKGFTKVGIMAVDNAYSHPFATNEQAALKAQGITDSTVFVPATAIDVTSQVSELQSKGVQAVVYSGLTQNMGYAIKARTKLGFNVPWMADLAASSLDLTTIGTPAQLKDVFEINFRPSVSTANVPGLAVMEKYAANHSDIATIGAVPVHIAGLAWDGVLMTARAAEQAKSTNAADIAHALENFGAGATDPNYINYANISYTSDKHQPVKASPDDYPITPIGPIKNGQVQATG
jgi:branched-chain amino acid transport system substrate-binding protein